MLKCLIAFILGYFASRMMGNGFSVGGTSIGTSITDTGIGHGKDNCCANKSDLEKVWICGSLGPQVICQNNKCVCDD